MEEKVCLKCGGTGLLVSGKACDCGAHGSRLVLPTHMKVPLQYQNVIELYTDGSFDRISGRCSGAYIAVEGGQILFCGTVKVTKPEYKESWNVSAELLTALLAVVMTADIVHADNFELTVVHDYEGVSKYVSGPKPWNARSLVSRLYTQGIGQFRQAHGGIDLRFRKVRGHSGDRFNEMADRLANGIVPECCREKMREAVEV